PNAVRIVDDRKSVDKGISVLWTIQRRKNSHAGCFSCTVGSNKAEHLSALHFERNIVDRFGVPKVAVQMSKFDHRRLHSNSASWLSLLARSPLTHDNVDAFFLFSIRGSQLHLWR